MAEPTQDLTPPNRARALAALGEEQTTERREAALEAARSALPEGLRDLLHQSADGNYACGEWDGQEGDEPYDAVYQRALAIDIRLAEVIGATVARVTAVERDAAFKVSRVAHYLLNDPGYTKRMAASALADIARKLDPEMAEQALGDAAAIPTLTAALARGAADTARVLGYNAALEWAAGCIEGGYPTMGDTADPRAIAMTLRAGRKPITWDVAIDYLGVTSDGTSLCTHETQVVAVDEGAACAAAEEALVASREASVRSVRATPARAALDQARADTQPETT